MAGPMNFEEGSELTPISSEKAIMPLTFDCITIEDQKYHLRKMVEANSRSLIPVRISTCFYISPTVTFNVVPAGKPADQEWQKSL